MPHLTIVAQPNEDVEVWLDTEGSRCDGTVIGVGATRDAALMSARTTLLGLVGDLEDLNDEED